MNPIKLIAGALIGFVAMFFAFSVLFGSWYTIDQGERGVLLRNGAVIGTAEPGLNFKFPLIDGVREISVQSQTQAYENLLAYSKDQQTAGLNVTVNYRLPEGQVEKIYSEYGGQQGILARLLDRKVQETVRTVFSQYNAVTAIQERAKLNSQIALAITDAVKGPITIESVQLENIDFSDAYEASIEKRMLAEVEVQKLRQNAEREKVQAEITVTQAKAQADGQKAVAEASAYAIERKAEANAKATKLQGEAEASAIKAKGDALRENPNLVELTQAEKWNGELPTTMVPNASVPFLGVK